MHPETAPGNVPVARSEHTKAIEETELLVSSLQVTGRAVFLMGSSGWCHVLQRGAGSTSQSDRQEMPGSLSDRDALIRTDPGAFSRAQVTCPGLGHV